VEVVPDLTAVQLDVYDSRQGGIWHPEHGALHEPEGWEFLPTGDAFVTRRVKAAGVYWTLWRPRGRNHPHRRLLGLWAPAAAIAQAQEQAAATADERSGRRAKGAVYRARREEVYRRELAEAIVAFLDFAPEHGDLARSIATEAAERAGQVGSGRVGRTRKLGLEDRAALAARALIRHRYTDYEDRLVTGGLDDDFFYGAVKADAHNEVDRYLEDHRRSMRPPDIMDLPETVAAALSGSSAPLGEIGEPHTDGGNDAPEQPPDRLLWESGLDAGPAIPADEAANAERDADPPVGGDRPPVQSGEGKERGDTDH
jgi:hypothetical protein